MANQLVTEHSHITADILDGKPWRYEDDERTITVERSPKRNMFVAYVTTWTTGGMDIETGIRDVYENEANYGAHSVRSLGVMLEDEGILEEE